MKFFKRITFLLDINAKKKKDTGEAPGHKEFFKENRILR